MAKVSQKDIDKFFKDIGLGGYSKKSEPLNLFKALGIIPEVDEDGNRVLTPYEILRTPPKFVNGKEVPIVFAIKNRAKRVGKYSGTDTLFFYAKKNGVKEGTELELALEELKKKYRHAIFLGNADEALSYLDMINSLTGGMGDEFKDSYYNYALFYKKMKKQLMMDMFAHFFLTYFFRYRNNIKEGLINKSSRFRPYFEKPTAVFTGNELNDIAKYGNFGDSKNIDFGDIKSIKFENNFDEFDDYSLDEITSTKSSVAETIGAPVQSDAVFAQPSAASITPQQPQKLETESSHQGTEAENKDELEERSSYLKNPKGLKQLLEEELNIDIGNKQDKTLEEKNNLVQEDGFEKSSLD